jgi:hypothetical protein
MKKLLLTLGLTALTFASAHAQGTINPRNGFLTPVKFDSNGNWIYDSTDRNITADDGIRFGVFWGAAGGPADTLAGVMTIGATPGILTGLPSIFFIQGAGDAGTIISLQIRTFSAGLNAQTETKQVKLAPASGPGTVIWSSSGADVNGSGTFRPILFIIPEPSTIALGGLAGAFLLLRARKRTTTR